MTNRNGNRCVMCGHAGAVTLCRECHDGVKALAGDWRPLLEACKAALLLAGDGDLPDNGEYSGAAITDQIRAAVAKAEGADPGAAGRGDVVTDLLRACKVVSLDRRIHAWLAENDPKALAQVETAIRKAEGGGV